VALINVIPDLGGSFEYLIRAGARARIGVARGRGSATGSIGAAFAWLLVEGGDGELVLDATTVPVSGRDDVFEGSAWSATLAPKTRFAIRGNLRYTMMGRSWTGEAVTRVIAPSEPVEERVGEGPDKQLVRIYLPEGPLICGETLNEPGRWSSWPPHRHEQEEVSFYRFDHPQGFGVQVFDTREGGQRAEIVRDGDVQRVRTGSHPVVAGPVGTMYRLWALAGTSLTLELEPDTRYT
jgi:5-deoxy-D-glucuronate isomerase